MYEYENKNLHAGLKQFNKRYIMLQGNQGEKIKPKWDNVFNVQSIFSLKMPKWPHEGETN